MMIITDSASDITRQEAEEMNIRIVWLKTKFSDGDFPLETEEDFTRFFEKLAAEKRTACYKPAVTGGISGSL